MKYRTFITSIHSKTNDNLFEDFVSGLSGKYKVKDIWDNVEWKAPMEYEEEQGNSLISKVVILDELLELDEIIYLKRYLMNKENEFSINNQRTLNLNPGYLSEDGMYLLTHKDNTERDREKLTEGIWQEKQYDFDKEYKINQNTFSEYSHRDRLRLFNSL